MEIMNTTDGRAVTSTTLSSKRPRLLVLILLGSAVAVGSRVAYTSCSLVVGSGGYVYGFVHGASLLPNTATKGHPAATTAATTTATPTTASTGAPTTATAMVSNNNATANLQCGSVGVKFFKLHKVGSTTYANALEAFAGRHDLAICPRSSKTETLSNCDIATTHEASTGITRNHGIETFFNKVAGRNALRTILLRHPYERILSRYYYDKAKTGKEDMNDDWSNLERFLDTRLEAEGKHYLGLTKDGNVQAAIDALAQFEIVGTTENMEQFIAATALMLGCAGNLSAWTYHSVRVVKDRPSFGDLPSRLQRQIMEGSTRDLVIYEAAQRRWAEMSARIGNLAAVIAEFIHIMNNTNTDCNYKGFMIPGKNKIGKMKDCLHYKGHPAATAATTTASQTTASTAAPIIFPTPTSPVLVVGLPKTGTGTLKGYFKCGGLATSHWKCGERWHCGICVRNNVKNHRDPLMGCGNWSVYSQLDVENPKRHLCYFPQVEALDALSAAYPNSTLLLNTRPAAKWLSSAKRWNRMDKRISKCNVSGLKGNGRDNDDDMMAWFDQHIARVRNFARSHPYHRFVEIDIETADASAILEGAFGISAKKCWGHVHETSKRRLLHAHDVSHNDVGLVIVS